MIVVLEAKMLKNSVGRPVTGENFYNRDAERARIWQHLEQDNLLLLAPRRVGKTSLIYRLADEAMERGAPIPALASVADADDEADFVRRLFAAVEQTQQAASVLRQLRRGRFAELFGRLKSISLGGVGFEIDRFPDPQWKDLGRELLRAIGTLDTPWLMIIDELPLFVLTLLKADTDATRARTFLRWFRDMRQGRPGVPDSIRWLLCGSIGLDTVARRHQMSATINDLRPMTLGAFTADESHRFLELLGISHDLHLTEAVRQRICERAGWLIPFHLQIFFAALREHCGDTGAAPDVAAVDAAFERLLRPAHRSYFEYWVQRLTAELGRPHDAQATALLAACVRDPQGTPRSVLTQVLATHISAAEAREEQLSWLLDVLVSDGYLVDTDDRYRFRSNLLREFWLRRVIA